MSELIEAFAKAFRENTKQIFRECYPTEEEAMREWEKSMAQCRKNIFINGVNLDYELPNGKKIWEE